LAGLAYCLVNPRGEVQPCAYLDVSAGNVRATPFSRIWAQSPLFLDLRRQEYRGSCGRCGYRRVCGGCRARAYSASGDYLGEDPWCLYRGGEGKEEAHLACHGRHG
ncbi:MAG: SPASM domain-containing protein, partial [Clostridia bacterium]|nr:SPASM domain-containing protein [Clostridia bacterium]